MMAVVGDDERLIARVLMADGTTRPIEDVEVGDLVLGTDPETGRPVLSRSPPGVGADPTGEC